MNKRTTLLFACLLTAGIALAKGHWVGTWGTAPQLVERHNNPPAPGLTNNSLRQIVQVSIGGKKVRLSLPMSSARNLRRLRLLSCRLRRPQAAVVRLMRHQR